VIFFDVRHSDLESLLDPLLELKTPKPKTLRALKIIATGIIFIVEMAYL
jgi:hypothetical protein